jgi:hypothetical protein
MLEGACFMASFVEYRENAAECARLALIAPSQVGRASFDAAAKHWMMLYRLTAQRATADSSGVNERSFLRIGPGIEMPRSVLPRQLTDTRH